jgi:predicted RNA-binding Zn ribbon-like protein
MKLEAVKNALPLNPAMQSLPSILFLPLTGNRPCLDFINTITGRLSPDKYCDNLLGYPDLLAFCLRLDLISVEAYAGLSSQAELSPRAAELATSEARAFRDAFSAILDDITGGPDGSPQPSAPRPKNLDAFDRVRHRARESETLQWNGFQMIPVPQPEQEGLDFPWLLLVRDAEELISSPLAARVRICAAEGCGWAFLDCSKNGGRRWCSMKLCGNRAKAARFRSKR